MHNLTYRYIDECVDPNYLWRIAYDQGISSWNGTGTIVHLYYYSESPNTLDAVFDEQHPLRGGLTSMYDTNLDGYADYGVVTVNIFMGVNSNLTPIQKQSIATHELGHLLGLGHIPKPTPPAITAPAIMFDWFTFEEMSTIYTPQPTDIGLISQDYP